MACLLHYFSYIYIFQNYTFLNKIYLLFPVLSSNEGRRDQKNFGIPPKLQFTFRLTGNVKKFFFLQSNLSKEVC